MATGLRTRWVGRVLTLAVGIAAGGGVALVTAGAAHASTVSFQNTPLASWRANGVGWAAVTLGNVAYVGGDFTTVTSPDGATTLPRAHLAAFNLTTGALIAAFRADTDGRVNALATDGTNIYVGGAFTHVNGVARSRVAAIDPATGQVRTAWAANASSVVYALATSGTDLYIAGAFGALKGQPRSRLAAVRLATGALEPWAPIVNNTVNSLAVTADGSRVYAGGNYTAVNGTAATHLTSLDAAGAVVRTSWTSLTGPVLSMQLDPSGTRLAVGVGGTANQGAVYDPSTGSRKWYQRCDGDGQAIRWIGDAVFTGFHEGCSGDTTIRVTSNDSTTGTRDTAFIPSFDKFYGVRALAGNSSFLLAAGDFTTVSGIPSQGFAIFPATPPPPVSLAAGTTWNYLDTGTKPAAGWTQNGFDASTWKAGAAQLGYGDGDEGTVISYGPDPTHKYITSYFRTTFTATAVPSAVTLGLLDDDGAVVYLNGVEVARDNMPVGPVNSATRASHDKTGAAESTVNNFSIPPSAVQVGVNTIAVEVHQITFGSSDLSFLATLSSRS